MEQFDTTAPVRLRRRQRVGALALAGLMLLAVSGTSGAAVARGADALGKKNPAKGEPVVIGMITEGESANVDGTFENEGFDIAVQFVNEYRGGLGGRPLELLICESQLDAGKAIDCANQMIAEEVPAVLIGGSSFQEQLWRPLHDAGIPVFMGSASAAAVLEDPDSTFVLADPDAAVVDLPLGIAKEAKTKKVSAAVIDVPAALEILEGKTIPKMKKAGIKMDIVAIAPGTPDVTPEMQGIVDNKSGEVFAIGNDALCIAIFNGLAAVGYKGKVAAVSQCYTDATKEAVPADVLEGLIITATAPIGVDDPSLDIFEAAIDKYNPGLEVDNTGRIRPFTQTVAFVDALKGIKGKITAAKVLAKIKNAPEQELVASGGQKFRCNGKANPASPAVCVRGTLVTTIDETGNPGAYDVVGASPIPN